MSLARSIFVVAASAVALTVAACGSPGNGPGFLPPPSDADVDVVLVPGDVPVVDTTPEPDTTPQDTGPLDTGPPDTGPPDTGQPDTGGGGCPANLPCDDGDLCTLNDTCLNGVCAGTPIDCADALSCTQDICIQGQCEHPVFSGSCLIDGECYSDNQVDPTNSCRRCAAITNATAWTVAVGAGGCDDGDPCTADDRCVEGSCVGGAAPPEICGNGIDDNCDSFTDDADVACGLPSGPCTYHTDCYPERLCGLWGTTGQLTCSDPCAGPGDCPANQVCTKVPGSAQVAYCQDRDTTLLPTGASCTDDTQCQSRICTGVCADLCLHEAECSLPNATCHPVGDLNAGLVAAACEPNSPNLINNGQACTTDGFTFGGDVCNSGHCDLMPFASTFFCAPLCKAESDCTPAQTCGAVLYSPNENPGAVPFDPLFTQPTVDSVTACFSPPTPGGTLLDGTPGCTSNAQCRSYHCLPLIPNDPTNFCTTFCQFDQECPSGFQCKLEAINLASAWLQATHVGSQPPSQARTFIRICKPE